MGITRDMSTVRVLSNLDIDTGIVGIMSDDPFILTFAIDQKGLDKVIDVRGGIALG